MTQILRCLLVSALIGTWAGAVLPQESPKSKASEPGAERQTREHAAAAKADTITSEQADAIITELKQIRQLLEKQQAQLPRAATPMPDPPGKAQLSVDDGWHSIGRADAPVTLVEFGDFQCPYCKKFHANAYAQLKKNYIDTGKLRFVSRDMPLEFHSFAFKAAEAARCAGDQQKYWELRDALFSNTAPPNDEAISKAVDSLSLDKGTFQACITSEKYNAAVQQDASDATALQVNGTPTFFLAKSSKDKLDGIRIVGAQPYLAFQTAIESVLKTEVASKN
jgi:protein-disulfide isomerase